MAAAKLVRSEEAGRTHRSSRSGNAVGPPEDDAARMQSRQPRVISVVAADDHAAYLRATTETLKRAGLHIVGVSTTGQGVIDFVRALAPDVALVDLHMPGISGTDVARTVRAEFPGTRVVILSAYDDPEIVEIALNAGATAIRHEGQHARGDRARGLQGRRRRDDAARLSRAFLLIPCAGCPIASRAS